MGGEKGKMVVQQRQAVLDNVWEWGQTAEQSRAGQDRREVNRKPSSHIKETCFTRAS